MQSSIPYGQWEKRWHPLRQEWIVYAAHRNSRPWNFAERHIQQSLPSYDPGCYLCPGNARVSGKTNPRNYDVFIFDNDHPVVGLDAPIIPAKEQEMHQGLFKRQQAKGIARVVCYDPRHNVTLNDVDTAQVAKVFRSLRDEMIFFTNHSDITSVLIFENKGELVGVSNPHPHCQIYATDFVFHTVAREMKAVEEHKSRTGRNLFDDILQAEQKDELRIIAQNENAIGFIPFFARFAYETYIFPRRRHATLATLSDEEIFDLAEVFQTITRKYDANFACSFPYIMAFSQAPVDGGHYPDYHMHLNICPPLRQPGLMKFLAGPETGADTFMADTMPEEKAAELRKVQL
jgi:UDPglucose--hexose-1-phosphate uridylyltransferase